MAAIGHSFEIWLSTVTAKSIRRSSILSFGDLEDKIVEFIEHHDEYLSKFYTWTLSSTFAILTLSDCISPCDTDSYD